MFLEYSEQHDCSREGVKVSALIERFKNEHFGIIEALKEVEELGIITKDGHAKLISLTVDLLNHIWCEDNWFYPILRKASGHNKKLKEELFFFINGLGTIHEKIFFFMDKYSQRVKGSNFQREYESLFGALRKRIDYEENILYGEFEGLNKLKLSNFQMLNYPLQYPSSFQSNIRLLKTIDNTDKSQVRYHSS